MASISHDLRHVLAVAFRRPDSDGDLLARFAASRDESAFAEIVRRHGPAVLRVCRSHLTRADADDAYQATFFVLARRADSLDDVKSLGGWLVGVAGRVARQLRKAGWRRSEVERKYKSLDSADREHDRNLQELNDELTRLPERLRDPLVLCFLQDRTQAEAAAELGQSVRTLRRRLDKAKDALRLRLLRRGVAATVFVPATPLVISSTAAARTAASAVQFLAGGVSTPAAILAKGIGMTSLLKLKVAAGLCAVAGVLTTVGVAQDATKQSPATPPIKSATGSVSGSVIATNLPRSESASVIRSTDDGLSTTVSTQGNTSVGSIISREAIYHFNDLSKRWFGRSPDQPRLKVHIDVNSNENSNSSTVMRFGTGGDGATLEEARLTLYGPLEPMLCDQLPGEIAHVVLAKHLGLRLPRWAAHGLAISAMSPDTQAKADSMVRAILNSGKGYRLQALFAMKEFPESSTDRAAYHAQASSMVRFLLTLKVNRDVSVSIASNGKNWQIPKTPQCMLPQFVQSGVRKNDWDRAISGFYDLKNCDELESAWLDWLKSDRSRQDLPTATPPPPLGPDPARIPPVNLGK